MEKGLRRQIAPRSLLYNLQTSPGSRAQCIKACVFRRPIAVGLKLVLWYDSYAKPSEGMSPKYDAQFLRIRPGFAVRSTPYYPVIRLQYRCISRKTQHLYHTILQIWVATPLAPNPKPKAQSPESYAVLGVLCYSKGS